MNKPLIIAGAFLLLVAAVAASVFLQNMQATPSETQSENGNETMMEKTPAPNATDGTMMEKTDDPMAKSNSYVDYSPQAFEDAAGKKRVYYFHAVWCPTCKISNEDFEKNEKEIPEDVVVFKTDYDSQSALKQKYAITYQHTFVQVDEAGNEVTKWSGGGVKELVENIR